MRVARVLLVVALLASGALVALLAAGSQAPVEAGRLAAADVVAQDLDLAPLVGLARAPTLLGVPIGEAPRRVLAVPEDAPADLGAMVPTGRAFTFTDPHGNPWTVEEYEAAWGTAYGTAVGPLTHDADAGAYNFVLLVDQGKVGSRLRIVAR